MQSDNTADIPWQLFAAFSRRQVRARTLAVHLHNTVSKVEVSRRVLVRKLAAEKLRQRLHLYLMDLVQLEPATAAGNDHCLARVLF